VFCITLQAFTNRDSPCIIEPIHPYIITQALDILRCMLADLLAEKAGRLGSARSDGHTQPADDFAEED